MFGNSFCLYFLHLLVGIIPGHLDFITMFAKQFRSVKIHTNAFLNLGAEETFTALVTSLDNCPLYLQTSSCAMEVARLPLEQSDVKKIPLYVFNLM